MYIDTHSQKAMEQSILEYFNITAKELNDLFFEASDKSTNDKFVDGDKLNHVFDTFIQTHLPQEPIDQILFFHLGRRLNSEQDRDIGKNLYDLLSTNNSLTTFLKECRLSSKIDPFGDIFTFNFDPLKADVQLY